MSRIRYFWAKPDPHPWNLSARLYVFVLNLIILPRPPLECRHCAAAGPTCRVYKYINHWIYYPPPPLPFSIPRYGLRIFCTKYFSCLNVQDGLLLVGLLLLLLVHGDELSQVLLRVSQLLGLVSRRQDTLHVLTLHNLKW